MPSNMVLERVLLIADSRGIHIPNTFYRNFDFKAWGLYQDDFSELHDSENENYWEAWDELLRQAKHVDISGQVWTLEQDGDLFAAPEVIDDALQD